MSWSRNVPTDPGYYWLREEGDSATAHIIELGAGGYIMRLGSGDLVPTAELEREGFEFWPEKLTTETHAHNKSLASIAREQQRRTA